MKRFERSNGLDTALYKNIGPTFIVVHLKMKIYVSNCGMFDQLAAMFDFVDTDKYNL